MDFPNFVAMAACDPQGIMGKNGTLPWNYPEDLDHFYRSTLNSVMIMGYKTYVSMEKKGWKDRVSLVMTKHHAAQVKNGTAFRDLQELKQIYKSRPELFKKTNFVIGGAEIFEFFFSHQLINSAIITHIYKSYEGDTTFPLHYLSGWPHETLRTTPDFTIVKYSQSG